MLNMPKKIKVGSTIYTTKETDETILVNGRECIGDIEYWEGLINIAKSAGDGMKPTTLMHELVHAITYEQMGNGFEHDEQYIDGLAAGIIMLIRDNPKLVDYILSSGKVSVDE